MANKDARPDLVRFLNMETGLLLSKAINRDFFAVVPAAVFPVLFPVGLSISLNTLAITVSVLSLQSMRKGMVKLGRQLPVSRMPE
jgi:hypothetical protein